MNDQHIIFSPERNQWTLTDGRHHMEVPDWAREIMRDEFERETRLLQAENAKLRELLAELYEDQCDDCDRWKYRDRMRELGVEIE